MPSLEIETLVVVRELGSGDALVSAAAEPERAAFGDPDEALLEAKMFLAEYLGRVDPETVARFALPEGTALHETGVVLPRDDLPARCALTTPVRIPCVVIPTLPNAKGVRDRWVAILPLDHVFYATADESLDEAIRAEARRIIVARELDAAALLKLLPGRADRLEKLAVVVSRDAGAEAGAQARKRLAEHEARKAAALVLASVAQPIHEGIDERPARPYPARDAERALFRSLLAGDERHSVLLVGAERVGKSALLRAWLADEWRAGRKRLVYSTSGAQLIAGMSGLGQWQERVRRVMEAAHTLDAVVWLDDLADLFSERPTGSVDIPSALKPYLEQGKVRVVGELRDDLVERIEARHGSFLSCFGRVRLAPLAPSAARGVLDAIAEHDRREEPHRPQVSTEGCAALVELSDRYLPYQAFPGKAVRLYDELRAAHELAAGSAAAGAPIAPPEVYDWFSARTGVPTFLLRDDRVLRREDVVGKLRARVIGQDAAVERVASLVCTIKAGLQPGGKPLSTLLFVGPTGVGKTELARALAELLFGDPARLVRFDMSEYADPFASERLFRGTERGEGLLTRQVREQPFCVVLLDEIEKAHRSVFDLLLQVCGEGRLTDGRGKTAYFHNAIVVMTSNLGAAHRRAAVGFEGGAAGDDAHYTRVVEQSFRPELVNRIDRVVTFGPLSRAELRRVARIAVERARRRRGLSERGIELDVSDGALDHLVDGGMSDAYGARGLRRHIERALVGPVAHVVSGWPQTLDDAKIPVALDAAPLLAGEEAGTSAGGLRFGVVRRTSAATGHEAHAMRAISDARRTMNRRLHLEPVVQLRDQIAYLVAQLGYGSDRKKKNKKLEWSPELGLMQEEHHALAEAAGALARAYVEGCQVEELALDAFFAGEPVASLVTEARSVAARFDAALVKALVAREGRRDTATLMASEVDDARALDLWLGPLLDDARRRKWELELHVDGDRDANARWPTVRRWGPPRSPDWMLDRLRAPDRAFKNVLLRVQGDHAAAWLGLEAGLVRYVGAGEGSEPANLLVTLVARRTTLTDKEWTPPSLDPPIPTLHPELRRRARVREIQAREGKVVVLGGDTLDVPMREYWPRYEEIALAHLLTTERRDDLDWDKLYAPLLSESFEGVLKHLAGGNVIQAIKLYREITGVGLKEAKDAVEAMR